MKKLNPIERVALAPAILLPGVLALTGCTLPEAQAAKNASDAQTGNCATTQVKKQGDAVGPALEALGVLNLDLAAPGLRSSATTTATDFETRMKDYGGLLPGTMLVTCVGNSTMSGWDISVARAQDLPLESVPPTVHPS